MNIVLFVRKPLRMIHTHVHVQTWRYHKFSTPCTVHSQK